MKHLTLTILTVLVWFNLQAQNDTNPYEIFGYEPKVKYEDNLIDYLQITNTDTTEKYKTIVFDFYNKSILFLDSKDSIINSLKYEPDQLLIWLSVDPLAHKYPGLSPYNFVENNPIIHIDPDGREKIVVTGGEYTSENRYKYNFVEPAIKQIKAYKTAAGTEQVTWAVMNVGYSDEAISTMRSVAKENGVSFVLLNSANELTNYVNSKSSSSADLSESRTADQVTGISVFGHGFSGSMEFGYNQDTDGTNDIQSKFSFGIDDASNLVEGAFNNPTIDIYTCNAMTPVGGYSFSENSLGGAIHKKSGGTVSGYWGRTDYANMNDGQTFGNKLNRKWNGFNTSGSINLPQAGTKTVDGQTYQSTKVTLNPPIIK